MPPPEDFLDWPDSPFRRVDWRFHRATLLANTGGRTDPSRDDKLIKQASKYLQRRNLAATPRQHLAARKSAPAIHGAVELAYGPPRVILELRGRILARQKAGEIAKLMGLKECEVEAYMALFFDVAAGLEATSYINFHVIGISPTDPATLEQRVLMAAWGHGPVMLEAMLDYYDRQQDPSLPQPEPGSDAWNTDKAIELTMAVDRISTYPSTKAGRDLIRALPALFEMIAQRSGPLTIGERLARRARTYWTASDIREREYLAKPGHAECLEIDGQATQVYEIGPNYEQDSEFLFPEDESGVA